MEKIVRGLLICVFGCVVLLGGISAREGNAAAQDYGGGLNMPAKPTVIETVVSKIQYEDLKTQSQCDVALFYVKSDLKVDVTGDLRVDDVMAYVMSKPAGAAFVPLFVARDSQAGTALAQKLNALGNANCIMGSDDGDVLETMRNAAPRVSGLLDLRGSPKMTAAQIRDAVTEAKSKIALIRHGDYSADEIFLLQKLLICVWSETLKDSVSIGGALVSGVNGVLSASGSAVNAQISKFSDTSMLRRNIIIGHRGVPSLAPDNTLEGAKLAVQNGADIVESDIYLSADNRLVVSHENELSINTDGNGLITTKTLEQIKQHKITQGGNVYFIPTLDEYFDEFKDSPIVHFVEIKDNNTAIVEVLKELIDSKGVWEQVVIISFHKSQLEAAAEALPNITRGNLNEVADIANTLNIHSAVLQTLNELVPITSTYNASRLSVDAQFARKLSSYGITCWPWTYANDTELKREYTYGYGGLTTDAVQAVSMYAAKLTVSEQISVGKGQTKLDIKMLSRLGAYTEDESALLPLDGKDVFLLPLDSDAIGLKLQSDLTLSAESAGEGWYVAGAVFTDGTVSYTIYSQPFKAISTSAAGGCGISGESAMLYGLPFVLGMLIYLRKTKA